MLNKEFGGCVERKEGREDGQFTINVDTNSPLFRYDIFTMTMININDKQITYDKY